MKQKLSFVCHWTKGLQRKAEFFCIRYFWRTKRKSTETMLFMSKQVSLPKISSILQKMKIDQKSDIRPFCTKAFNCQLFIVFVDWCLVNKTVQPFCSYCRIRYSIHSIEEPSLISRLTASWHILKENITKIVFFRKEHLLSFLQIHTD